MVIDGTAPPPRRAYTDVSLLSHAFATYYAKGRKTAGLGVDMTDPTGAYGLYRSVGMAPAFEFDDYERTVPVA